MCLYLMIWRRNFMFFPKKGPYPFLLTAFTFPSLAQDDQNFPPALSSRLLTSASALTTTRPPLEPPQTLAAASKEWPPSSSSEPTSEAAYYATAGGGTAVGLLHLHGSTCLLSVCPASSSAARRPHRVLRSPPSLLPLLCLVSQNI
jgi:hypothetical protein